MIRTPLRPLASILKARADGGDPDQIERDNIRKRHEVMRDTSRQRAETRLILLIGVFALAFSAVGVRMGQLAASEPAEPIARVEIAPILNQRADIVDRRGRLLATNIETHALYAQPRNMVDPRSAARGLEAIFPQFDADTLYEKFIGSGKFIWLKRQLSPEQRQAVHDLGEPGLLFGPRETRLYPNGRLAAHVLGGTGFGREAVNSAEIIGVAGVEQYFDDNLRDPGRGEEPVTLSLDLGIQSAVETVMRGGIELLHAKGGAAVLMDAHSGEIVSLVSLPDFDPNNRPVPASTGDPASSPLFNRAVQGVYELGSTFKVFTVAQALELGLVEPDSKLDTKGPLVYGRHKIRDFRNYGDRLSVTKTLIKSSNIGTARLAMMIGPEQQRHFLGSLGLTKSLDLQMPEAVQARPLLPARWSEISSLTISYGHGLSTTPLHLAAAYAGMVNGGTKVTPTLLQQSQEPIVGPRLISQKTSDQIRAMMRLVVTKGTASFGEVQGYAVGGKTGTADKPLSTGRGYHKDKVIAVFASAFPMYDPKYVLVVALDEPEERSGDKPRRTAGWTAVPVSAEIIARVAPLLGLRPEIEPREIAGISLVSIE